MDKPTTNISFFYALEDIKYYEDLRKMLSSVARKNNNLKFWSEQDILPGEQIDRVIEDQIQRSKVFVFLVSADFLASDWAWDNVIPKVLKRRQDDEAIVCISVIIRPCIWEDFELAKLSVILPENHIAVSNHPDRDGILREIALELLKIIGAEPNNSTRGAVPSSSATPATNNIADLNTLYATKIKLHSDIWSQEDLLGYGRYAQVISQIIKSKDSTPPLTIAIIAPWGHGKTTLMRYIKEQLDNHRSVLASNIKALAEQEKKLDDSIQYRLNPGETEEQAKARFIKEETKNKELEAQTREQRIKTWLEEYRKEQVTFDPLIEPTIWFNPWQYQSSQQIWSGMAHAIINQLVEKLPKLRQEEFWLKLHLRRVDQHAIRKEIYKTIFIRLVPNLLFFLSGMILMLAKIGANASLFNTFFAGFLMLASSINGIFAWFKENAKGLEESYDNFFRSPDYESEKGMFHEVNEDLKIVFELLAKGQKVTIFIDDLDRCSPGKIVEVIEAINLMMNGDYHKDCYFVIGMDAQVVAAALDASYKDLHGKLADRERMQGSIGWYFLDKFIQLPFFIPSIKEDSKKRYLEKLFHQYKLSEEENKRLKNTLSPKDLNEAAQRILEAQRKNLGGRIKEIRTEFDHALEKDLDQVILFQAFEQNQDSEEILQQVHDFSEFLEDSPRSLKRFANMLRFYTAMQQLRSTKELPNASTESLAKWLTITLRWPQMVRWIQWSHEDKFQHPTFAKNAKELSFEAFTSTDPGEKAGIIDGVMGQLNKKTNQSGDEGWKGAYQKDWLDFCAKNEHLPWLKDKELFQLLYEYNASEASLVKALEADVW